MGFGAGDSADIIIFFASGNIDHAKARVWVHHRHDGGVVGDIFGIAVSLCISGGAADKWRRQFRYADTRD